MKDELKLEIEILPSQDIYNDMKLLYYAPVVIQGGCGGSFGFFGGFFNGDYYFTNVNLNENHDKNNVLSIKGNNIFYYKDGMLYHKELASYENTSEVIKLLRK